MKMCSKCGQAKADEDFEIRDATGHRRAQCRQCRKRPSRAKLVAPVQVEPPPLVWPVWGGPVSSGDLVWRV